MAHASSFFKCGDLVKITNFRVRPGHSKAFESKFIGPYKIVNCLNELNYELVAPDKRRELVHYNRMSHNYARDKIVCCSPSEFDQALFLNKPSAVLKAKEAKSGENQLNNKGFYNMVNAQAKFN